MEAKRRGRLIFLSCLFVVALAGLRPGLATAQESDDEESRAIFASEFLNSRPAAPVRRTTPPTRSSASTKPKVNATPSSDLLGITMWQLRPAVSNDDTQARLLDHDGDEESVLVAQRVTSDTKFKEGQKVRLSIESSRTGYLYVVDREQYADGTLSDPYLIFPTLKMRNGDNAVTAGRLIEIPDQNDHPFYFKMKRNRPDQVGEILTVLVMPKPMSDLALSRKPLKLTNEQVAQWEQQWKAPAKHVELTNHRGRTYTRAEMSAGANQTTLLRKDDPPPQTIYRVSSKPGDPMLVTVSLQYEPK